MERSWYIWWNGSERALLKKRPLGRGESLIGDLHNHPFALLTLFHLQFGRKAAYCHCWWGECEGVTYAGCNQKFPQLFQINWWTSTCSGSFHTWLSGMPIAEHTRLLCHGCHREILMLSFALSSSLSNGGSFRCFSMAKVVAFTSVSGTGSCLAAAFFSASHWEEQELFLPVLLSKQEHALLLTFSPQAFGVGLES